MIAALHKTLSCIKFVSSKLFIGVKRSLQSDPLLYYDGDQPYLLCEALSTFAVGKIDRLRVQVFCLLLNLRTVLFHSLCTHQCSTEEGGQTWSHYRIKILET